VILVYDDYKFLTRSELDGLGLSHLIGTDFVRAYMHGFFLDIRLYRKVSMTSHHTSSVRKMPFGGHSLYEIKNPL